MNASPVYTEAFKQMVAGRSVIPLGSDKRPLVTWKPYQEAAADETQVEQWWNLFPTANLGIVTGKISGIIVIDIDTYKEGTTKLDAFPETYTVRTGNGGYHLYYSYVPNFTISANSYPQWPGVDIRADGGYIVAPPSVTSYTKDGVTVGGPYTVLKALPLAPFPANLFPESKPRKTLNEVVGAGEGVRNDSLASIIGKLLRSENEKKWFSEVLPAVEKINATYKPPLPNDELMATFNSIVALERNQRAATSGGEDNEEENDLRQGFIRSKATGTFELARYIVNKFNIITIGEHDHEIYVYRNGIYFLAENEIIFPEIQRILGPLVTKNAKSETLHKITDMTMFPREVFSSAPLNFIPLLNGVYDRETNKLLPHDPKYRFTYQFPITYDSAADCTKTNAFFDQVLTPEQRLTVEEWIGYYFYRSYMFKKAIIFVGEGDTGKTTLLEVIDFLLGKKNISSVSLQKMSSDKFAAAQLFEKHGNLVDELSAKDISDTGNFKVATGGGSISGEYKFGNQFSFHNFSKLTFACNKIPDVKDFDDDAYFNRWMVIRFEKTIEHKIPNFIKTLSNDVERSGLFNLAMKGLTRLLESGKFSYGKDAIDTKLEMMRSGSSIAVFAADMLKQENGAEITKEDLYDIYTQFCAERGLAAETIKMLGTKLPFYVPYLAEGLISTTGSVKGTSRPRGWRNIAVISPDSQTFEDYYPEATVTI